MNKSWGNLTLLRTYREPVTAKNQRGEPYDTGEQGEELWELECACGKIFTMEQRRFPGRRKMKDCGDTCPLRANEATQKKRSQSGRPVGRPRRIEGGASNVTMYASKDIQKLVDELVEAKRYPSKSQAWAELVELGAQVLAAQNSRVASSANLTKLLKMKKKK